MNKNKRKAIYKKFNGRCAYCGRKITYEEMQVDHIIPRRNFEKISKVQCLDYEVSDRVNLYPSCPVCNRWKKTFSLEQFRYEIASQLKRVRDRSAGFRLLEKYKLIKVTKHKIVFHFEKEHSNE